MAADELALLFRLKGDASGIKAATAEARQAIGQIKQAFGPELAQTVSVTNKAFSDVGIGLQSLTQRIPIVGNTVSRLTDLLRGAGVESRTVEKSVSAVANSIGSIAQASGKSIPQVAQFLTRFTQIAGAAERDSAAVEFFGASLATKLTPQLAEARVALGAVSAESAAAGSALAGLAIPIGAAVIAVAALVAGLALVSRELFDVSKRTAEFQGKMQDLSQQTGVTVETLSTLEVAIATTGGTLNTVTQALVQFQRHLDEAQDPLSKAAGNFEQLGVAVEDTESTLRATLTALARMPEGFKQTNAAAEVFGSRGGKQVLALLKETNGDIDAFQQKLRDASILITSDAARSADRFNDELALLDFQLRSLGAAVAKDLIPPLTDLVRNFAELVRVSKPLLGVIGAIANPVVRTAAGALRGLGLVTQALTGDFDGLRRSIKEVNEEAEKLKNIPALNVAAPTPVALRKQSTAQAARDAVQQSEAVVAAAKRAAQETNQALNAAFEQGRVNRDQQANDTIAANARVLNAEKKRIEAELKLEEDRFKQIRDRQDLAESEREELLSKSTETIRKLQQQELDAQSLFDTTSRELRSRAAKERADSLRNQARNETDILLGELDRQLAALNTAIERGLAPEAETQALTTIEQLEQAKIDARRESLEEQKRIGFLTVENQKDIDAQIQQLNQESDRLQDEQRVRREQRQREHSERIRQLKLQEIQSLLDAEKIAGESIIAAIQSQAALRIRTEESASREILRIRLALVDDELDALRAQQQAASGISNVDQRAQVLAELNGRIRILLAERAAIESQGARDINEAQQQDLRNEREYEDELREIRERTTEIQRDTAQEIIRLMRQFHVDRRTIIRAQRDLDLQDEADRHQQATESIRAQQQETDQEIRVLERRLERLTIGTTEEIEEHDRLIASLERLRAKRAELDAQQKAEDARNEARGKGIKKGAEDDEREIDPFGRIKTSLEDIQKISQAIESTIVPLNEILKSSFLGVADAIGQTVQNYVLLGTTGPAVIRRILAQALAAIAAEAAVNSIKELALGFATLFYNPAESAGHFTAAGLWAALAGGAALAGRGVAGNLFQPKAGGAAGAGSGTGTRATDTPRPFDITRQQQREELHIFVYAEPGRGFSDEVVRAMVSDVQRNGPARDVIVRTAGG
jgi:hypothetical protein